MTKPGRLRDQEHIPRHCDRRRRGADRGQQPDGQLGETDTAVRKSSFTSDLAGAIDKADLMCRASRLSREPGEAYASSMG